MKYKLEYKPETPASGAKYLVLDTDNPYPVDNPLHAGYQGRIIAETLSQKNGQLVVDALNGHL